MDRPNMDSTLLNHHLERSECPIWVEIRHSRRAALGQKLSFICPQMLFDFVCAGGCQCSSLPAFVMLGRNRVTRNGRAHDTDGAVLDFLTVEPVVYAILDHYRRPMPVEAW